MSKGQILETIAEKIGPLLSDEGAQAEIIAERAFQSITDAGFVVVPREPTEAMAEAAWADTGKPTPEERMALELCDNKAAFLIKAKRRYRAMISTFQQDQEGDRK